MQRIGIVVPIRHEIALQRGFAQHSSGHGFLILIQRRHAPSRQISAAWFENRVKFVSTPHAGRTPRLTIFAATADQQGFAIHEPY